MSVNDLLATTLLDIRYRSRAVPAILFDHADSLAELLKAVPADVDLWEATDEEPRARPRCLGGSEGWR